jgi:methyl-accepting chemotaxis protein
MEIGAHKRRIYLINKKLQLKYAALLVITLTVVSFFVGAILYTGIWSFALREFSDFIIAEKISTVERIIAYESARYGKEYHITPPDELLEESKRLSEHEKESIKEILKKVNLKLLPRLFLVVLVIGLASIFLTHRIAGPLYRFRKNVKAISEGDLSVKFNIRRGDEFRELADELSVMTKRLLDVIVRFRELSENIFAHAQSLSHSIKQLPLEERQEITATFDRIVMLSKELKELSNFLKIEKEKR